MVTTSSKALLLAAAATLAACCASAPDRETDTPGEIGPFGEERVALCYSGFRAGQHPDRGNGAVNPSRSEILEDLTLMSLHGVRLIRVYDSGANSQDVIRLIQKEQIPIRVLLGVWLKAEVSNHLGCAWLNEPIPAETLAENKRENAAEVQRAIAVALAYPEVVSAVNVGNEALVDWNDHMVPLEGVIDYVRTVRSAVPQPVTVADNWAWWTTDAGGRLAEEVDFLGVHTYPVWEGKAIEAGLPGSVADIESVHAAIPGKPIAVLEAGWASTGAEFGARASEAAQERYVTELLQWAEDSGTTVFLFEAFDEPWKGDPGNAAGAEKHWGLWNVDRTPKAAVRALTAATAPR